MSGGGAVKHAGKPGYNFVVSGSDNIMNIAGDNTSIAGAAAIAPKPKAKAQVKPKPSAPPAPVKPKPHGAKPKPKATCK